MVWDMSMKESVRSRILEVSDGVVGLLMGLGSAQRELGDDALEIFFKEVPQQGDALWKRYRIWEKETGEDKWFKDFVIAMVTVAKH